MALVMLPSDLPWWSTVNRKLTAIQNTTDLDSILEIMQSIHDLCNVSLDPEDDKRDSTVLDGLRRFVEDDLKDEERTIFLEITVKNIAKRAQNIKILRPPRGLNFSLQQQVDTVELDHFFVASLLANAFFSTFPKRTEKTHPTLQDFNFSNFFRSLDSNCQKAKLRCFLQYFSWLETQTNIEERLKISRKVMTGKQWLTIEDWTECGLPLCPLDIKHQGRIENAFDDTVQTIFSSARLGGNILYGGVSQECVELFTIPEAMVSLLFTEALEDNESLLIEGVYQIARVMDPKNKAVLDILLEPRQVSACCIDAENYCVLPVDQFEEDNILRELNKCLLAFRQHTSCVILENREKKSSKESNGRLSPIGESGSSSPRDIGSLKDADTSKDIGTTIVIKQPSTSTMRSSSGSDKDKMENNIERRRSWLTPEPVWQPQDKSGSVVSGPTASGRRGRFIVLGSSGECLPVNRISRCGASSPYSSCDSDGEEYHSAKGSFDNSDDEKNSIDLDVERETFVKRLNEALRQSSNYTDSTESSYAVGISISGSQNCDEAVRVRRGGSTGFVLTEDSLDEDFYKNSLEQEKEWLDKFRTKQQAIIPRKDANDSSKYSFSTEYSSELEEVYEQFSKWLEDPAYKDETKELDPRDAAVLRFAHSLLKRTLSESFVGVPLTDGCVSSAVGLSAEAASIQEFKQKRNKLVLNARSLSVELAKYKHRLAAQLKKAKNDHHTVGTSTALPSNLTSDKPPRHPTKKHKPLTRRYLTWSVSCSQSLNCDDITLKISQLGQKHGRRISNLRPVATGNWGCGSTRMGDVQLKLVVQWMAASIAGLPVLVYYTTGHEKLTKLDTVRRVLLDRKWTVGELASATLLHAQDILEHTDHSKLDTQCFFEKLIGI